MSSGERTFYLSLPVLRADSAGRMIARGGHMRRARALVAVTILALAAVSCRDDRDPAPARLRVGIIAPVGVAAPPADADTLRARYQPLVAYLERTLQLPCDLHATRDLSALAVDFEAGRFDIAFLGAADFTSARERRGAIPLVMRENDRLATAVFVAAANDARTTIEDFKGASLTFGPRFSSSHLMARHYLEKQGIIVETFFRQVAYSERPEDTALLAGDGSFELAVTGAAALFQLFQVGRLRPDQVKVVWETPPYVSTVWAAAAELPPALVASIRDAFLALSPDRPGHAVVLSALGATSFLPASTADFLEMSAMLHQMGLVDGERARR